MNDTQKAKIKRFLDDKVMSEAVYEVLLSSFLKEQKDKDVYLLAASRLAVDFLHQGWKELERNKSQDEERGEKATYV